jgi:hypothetical protein
MNGFLIIPIPVTIPPHSPGSYLSSKVMLRAILFVPTPTPPFARLLLTPVTYSSASRTTRSYASLKISSKQRLFGLTPTAVRARTSLCSGLLSSIN